MSIGKTLSLEEISRITKSWFENAEGVEVTKKDPNNERSTFQYFRNEISSTEKIAEQQIVETIKEHKLIIARSAIYSSPFTEDKRFVCLNGFLNQVGRLPTLSDNVIIEYPKSMFLRRFESFAEFGNIYEIRSLCRIKIIKRAF